MTEDHASCELMPAGTSHPLDLEDAALDLLRRIPQTNRSGARGTTPLFRNPLFTENQALALARRKGWDGNPPGTLQDAADVVGLSRERIRQLELKLDKWNAEV